MGRSRRARSWVIIGGGVHGVHVATRLIAEGTDPARVRILDPADRLLERWRTCTATTGMTHLRSTAVHHIDVDPMSLRQFARERGVDWAQTFAPPYDRPSLELFNAHCDRVIESYGLRALHVLGKGVACSVDDDGVTVRTDRGDELRSTHVVLALGASEQPERPAWAPSSDPRVVHLFERGFELPLANAARRVAIVGGGISAAQTGLRLVVEGHEVHLISRHAFRQHQFDSDPGWNGPKHMTRFLAEESVDRRRSMITGARHRGSVPPGVLGSLRRAIGAGNLAWHRAGVNQVAERRGQLHLQLTTGDDLAVDRILLATGFCSSRPGGVMLDRLIDEAALPLARCGYPIVDAALRWHRRIQVTGPLAELELGPTSRNISGARQAGEKIVATVSRRHRTPPGGFAVGRQRESQAPRNARVPIERLSS